MSIIHIWPSHFIMLGWCIHTCHNASLLVTISLKRFRTPPQQTTLILKLVPTLATAISGAGVSTSLGKPPTCNRGWRGLVGVGEHPALSALMTLRGGQYFLPGFEIGQAAYCRVIAGDKGRVCRLPEEPIPGHYKPLRLVNCH